MKIENEIIIWKTNGWITSSLSIKAINKQFSCYLYEDNYYDSKKIDDIIYGWINIGVVLNEMFFTPLHITMTKLFMLIDNNILSNIMKITTSRIYMSINSIWIFYMSFAPFWKVRNLPLPLINFFSFQRLRFFNHKCFFVAPLKRYWAFIQQN